MGFAGVRLLDHCVSSYRRGSGSCGTHAALWSDDAMPDSVGVVTNFQVYSSFGDDCKLYGGRQCQVMRCSTMPNDFIYKYVDSFDGCNFGFCGMD